MNIGRKELKVGKAMAWLSTLSSLLLSLLGIAIYINKTMTPQDHYL